MAAKKKTATTTKPKMSKSAARAEGAQKQKAARDAAKDAPLHEGTVVRGDGQVVKVTVPPDDAPASAEATPKKQAKGGRPAKQQKGSSPKPAKPPKAAKAPRPKRTSLLDAAAAVLAEAKGADGGQGDRRAGHGQGAVDAARRQDAARVALRRDDP